MPRAAVEYGRPSSAAHAMLALAFVVDSANLSRDSGDLLEALIWAAIIQANQAAFRHEPAVRADFGASAEVLPDELRRPISVNAVAQSLRLPFETVRRRVTQLVERAQCVVTPHGVYVPGAAITQASHAAVQSARLARLNLFHDALVGAGVLTAGEALPRPLPDALKRPVNRLLSDYMLRTTDRAARLAGGVREGLVLLGLCDANTRSLIEDVGPDGRDELRPCSARALADRLGLPHETVRRRLLGLQSSGFARREGRGWIADAPPFARTTLALMLTDQEADLRRLFLRLKELLAAQGTNRS